MCDPGTVVSPFAVGFYAVDLYSPFLFLIDEIYETEPDETTVGAIVPKIIAKADKWLGPGSIQHTWKRYYDSAASWFAVDARKRFGVNFTAVEKKPGDKETALQTIQEMFLQRRFLISQNCPNAIWEFDNYYKDKKGRFVKKNDNQIDNTRYLIWMTKMVVEAQDAPTPDPTKKRKAKSKRFFTLDEDRQSVQGKNWQNLIFNKFK